MNSIFAPETLSGAIEPLMRIGISVILGALIGYEREVHGRPAGIRTHMLIILGVTIFCEVSRAFAPNDPARIAAQIITGIGFLGAGTILRIGAEVKGLTSAASIWATAAIGMAVSASNSMLWVAVVGTILTLVTLSIVNKIELILVPHAHPRNIQIVADDGVQVDALLNQLTFLNSSLKSIKIVTRAPLVVNLDVVGANEDTLCRLGQLQGVSSVQWTD